MSRNSLILFIRTLFLWEHPIFLYFCIYFLSRYAGYVGRLVANPRYIPHKNIVFLKSFTMTGVPVFNKARLVHYYGLHFGFVLQLYKIVIRNRPLIINIKYHILENEFLFQFVKKSDNFSGKCSL